MTGWIDLPPAASTGRGSASWGDGYVVDAPYFEPVLTDLSPAWLSFLSVLHGQPPLDLARPLTWLDLGAASGISACMVAAANPTVDVWGFDHNPGHVERGRGLAARAGLANCHFEEASFATLAADRTIGPAEADVIVVSGVYSWVSAANQGHIREIIRQRLRPGGLAYVMYETAPGWSSMVPLAEALRLLTDADGRRPDQAFHDAAAALQALAEAGSPYFPLGAREQVQMDGWPDADGFYAAHEYLGHHFGPLLFDDVVHAMGEARCSYLGQVDATDHLAAYWAPPAVIDVVHGAPDPVTRELYRDLIGQRPLRRDLYRRGLQISTPLQHQTALADLQVVGLGHPFRDDPVNVVAGGITLDPAFYQPLLGVLTTQRLDIATILEIHTDWTFLDAAVALSLLVAAGYAAPAATGRPSPDAVAACDRLTGVLIDENRLGADHATVLSPVAGSAVEVDSVGVLALGELWDGAAPDPGELADRVLDGLGHQGRLIRHERELVADRDTARTVAAERTARLLGLLGPHQISHT